MTGRADIKAWFDAEFKDYESRAKAAEAEERAYKLRRAEHDALEKQQLKRLADLATKVQEAQDLLEATERETELLKVKGRGEYDQLIAQAHDERDALRSKYKRIAKDLEAA